MVGSTFALVCGGVGRRGVRPESVVIDSFSVSEKFGANFEQFTGAAKQASENRQTKQSIDATKHNNQM